MPESHATSCPVWVRYFPSDIRYALDKNHSPSMPGWGLRQLDVLSKYCVANWGGSRLVDFNDLTETEACRRTPSKPLVIYLELWRLSVLFRYSCVDAHRLCCRGLLPLSVLLWLSMGECRRRRVDPWGDGEDARERGGCCWHTRPSYVSNTVGTERSMLPLDSEC